MNTIKLFVVSLFVTMAASAETVIIPVQDFLFTHQNFLPPKFNFNSALQGNANITNPPKMDRKTKKELEKELIYFIQDVYPEVENVRIFNGNIILKVEETK